MVNALAQVTAFCHPSTTAATLFGESRVSWTCGGFPGVTSMDREPLTALQLLQNQRENALELKPWLAQRNIKPSHTTLGWTAVPRQPCC